MVYNVEIIYSLRPMT